MVLTVKKALFQNGLPVEGYMGNLLEFERICQEKGLYHGMVLDLCLGSRSREPAFFSRNDLAVTYADLFVRLDSISGTRRGRYGVRRFCPCATVELPDGQRRELIVSREMPGMAGVRTEFSPWVKEMILANQYHDISKVRKAELACLIFEDTESLVRRMRQVKEARTVYALEGSRAGAGERPCVRRRVALNEVDALFYEL